MNLLLPSPLTVLELPLFVEKDVTVYLKRDDLIHPIISGNKWRKLHLTLAFCEAYSKPGIVTFGGAHSNHLLATAYLCQLSNRSSVGIIRGERPKELSPTLQSCIAYGMELVFVSRTDYSQPNTLQQQYHNAYPNYHWVPEGGADELGIEGCRSIVDEITVDFDYITVDCGTAATLAGICRALKPHQKAVGISVLKGDDTLHKQVEHFNVNKDSSSNYEINSSYHFGGYAHFSAELVAFMNEFYQFTGIKTDPVYTGKQFYGVLDLIKKDYFSKGSTIIIVHTGGLQGISGYEKRFGVTIY